MSHTFNLNAEFRTFQNNNCNLFVKESVIHYNNNNDDYNNKNKEDRNLDTNA